MADSQQQQQIENDAAQDSGGAPARSGGKYTPLTTEERARILQELQKRSKDDGKELELGAITEVSKQFGVCRGTVSRIWTKEKEPMNNERPGGKYKPLTAEERAGILEELQKRSIGDGKELERGAITEVSKKFGVCIQTVHKIWKTEKEPTTNDEDGSARIRSGGKLTPEERAGILEELQKRSIGDGKELERGAITQVSKQFGVCVKTVHKIWKKEKEPTNSDEDSARIRPGGKYKQLTPEERNGILQELLKRSEEGGKDLERGAITEVAKQFGVTIQTVYRLWTRAKESLKNGNSVMDVSSRKKNCGRKRKDYGCIERIKDIPLNQRGTIRSAAAALGIPKSTFHGYIQRGEVKLQKKGKMTFWA